MMRQVLVLVLELAILVLLSLGFRPRETENFGPGSSSTLDANVRRVRGVLGRGDGNSETRSEGGNLRVFFRRGRTCRNDAVRNNVEYALMAPRRTSSGA